MKKKIKNCPDTFNIYTTYHVILEDHMIKGLSDFMDGSLSRHVTILPSLVAINIVVVEILWF